MAKTLTGWALFLLFAPTACTLVLDTDALQNGNGIDTGTEDTPTESESQPPECTENADCSDAIPCTVDECGSDGKCTRTPDNNICLQYEMCDPIQGCIRESEKCVRNSDCDDSIDCTIDICSTGDCHHSPDHTRCENSVPFCRHPASCIPDRGGCVEGELIRCDLPEGGICLTASCNETNGDCETHLSAGADNDSDSALDILCGGDDCQDTDGTVYPDAVEVCDGKDNNCDSITDAVFPLTSPVTVAQGTDIAECRVAAADSDTAVIYYMGGIRVSVVTAEGDVLALDMSTLSSGTITHAAIAANPLESGVFYLLFVESVDNSAETLQVARLERNSTGDAVTGAVESSLDHQVTTTITDLTIVFDTQRTTPGWLAVWSENDDSAGFLRFQSHDMTAAMNIGTDLREVGRIDVAVSGAAQYEIVYSATDTALGGDNSEIYSSQIQFDTAFTTSEPLLISPADNDNQGDNDNDPSTWPAVAINTGDGSRATVFLDDTGFGSKNITLQQGDATEVAAILPTATLDTLHGLNLFHDGEKLVLFYSRQTSTHSRIIIDQLLPDPLQTQSLERLAQTNLVSVGYPAQNIRSLDVAVDPTGRYALSWVLKTDAGYSVQLATAQSCERQ